MPEQDERHSVAAPLNNRLVRWVVIGTESNRLEIDWA